eukprot:361857-Chlamydomonas_euryale.AAC.3
MRRHRELFIPWNLETVTTRATWKAGAGWAGAQHGSATHWMREYLRSGRGRQATAGQKDIYVIGLRTRRATAQTCSRPPKEHSRFPRANSYARK